MACSIAADILIDAAIPEPVADLFAIERRLVVARVGVAVEVPGRIDKRVHGVGFAARRTTALRAGGVDELRHAAQRRAAGQGDVDVLRQNDGQVFFRYGNDAVLFAIQHGDGRAPVALARDAPVLQAIGDGGFAETILLGVLRHGS